MNKQSETSSAIEFYCSSSLVTDTTITYTVLAVLICIAVWTIEFNILEDSFVTYFVRYLAQKINFNKSKIILLIIIMIIIIKKMNDKSKCFET